jgi:hypothetical protein
MSTLKTILENVQTFEFKGRYNLQLELPSNSTLSDEEVEFIAKVASWDINPNSLPINCGGVRSFLLPRKNVIYNKGVAFRALDIGGIGYFPFEHKKGNHNFKILSHQNFNPPSKDNFKKTDLGKAMGTSYFKNGKKLVIKSDYSALGTYTEKLLQNKILLTNLANSFNLSHWVVPQVEMYGRYLDEELSYNDEPFGFLVSSLPYVNNHRALHQLNRFKKKHFNNYSTLSDLIYDVALEKLPNLIRGLKELHDRGYVHLQMHNCNYFLTRPLPCVVDWETLRESGNNLEDHISNRSYDVCFVLTKYINIFDDLLKGVHLKYSQMIKHNLTNLFMSIYSNENLPVSFSDPEAWDYAYGQSASGFKLIKQKMKNIIN